MAETIIYTAGCWDLFHVGHLNLIERASKLGDRLIVGVSTDQLVKKCKGENPIIPFSERIEIIRSIKYVDEVVVQEELLPIRQLFIINMDIMVLGNDWEDSKEPGILWVKNNKKMVFLPRTEGISSTWLKRRIKEAGLYEA